MSQCSVCNQDNGAGEVKRIYTARELKRERGQEHMVYGGGTEVTVTTTYGEFQEHNFFVCADCLTRRDKVAKWVIIGATILLTVALVAVSAARHMAWAYLAALIALIGGLICSDLVSTDYRIKGFAKQQRGSGLPVEAFNERRYRKLMEDNQRRL